MYPHQHYTLADRRPGWQQGSLPGKSSLKYTSCPHVILSSTSDERFQWKHGQTCAHTSCCGHDRSVLKAQWLMLCAFLSLSVCSTLICWWKSFSLIYVRLNPEVCHTSVVASVWSSPTLNCKHTAVYWKVYSIIISQHTQSKEEDLCAKMWFVEQEILYSTCSSPGYSVEKQVCFGGKAAAAVVCKMFYVCSIHKLSDIK